MVEAAMRYLSTFLIVISMILPAIQKAFQTPFRKADRGHAKHVKIES
jgi:hypothetical protein